MALFPRWGSRSRAVRAAVDDEIAFHLRERIDTLVSEGRSRAEAERAARDEFGDPDAVRRALAAIDLRIVARRHSLAWLDAVHHDLRHVVRSLASTPGFTLLVIGMLALGIGANGAVFAFVDRLFLRAPAGIGDPATLVRLYRLVPSGAVAPPVGGDKDITAYMPYGGLASIAAGLDPGTVSGYLDRRIAIGRGESPPLVRTNWIGAAYFRVLGVAAAALGRYPTDDECRIDAAAPVAVISYDEWQRSFGGDPQIIGTRVELDRVFFTIVGVAARGFGGIDLDPVRYWVPMGTMPWRFKPPWYEARNSSSVRVFARTGGRSRPQMQGEATAAYRAGAPPREQSFEILAGPVLETGGPQRQGQSVDIAVRLAGVAALVLLIACANASSLLLARATHRRREFAVRMALGISRTRLIGLLLGEAVALSVAAAAVSLFVAYAGTLAMHQVLMADAAWVERAFDLRIAVLSFGAAALAALLTGVPVAWRLSRAAVQPALQDNPRTGSVRRFRLQSALLVVQVTLSIVLLTGAAAFIQSLRAIAAIDTGYDVDRLLLIKLRYDDGTFRSRETADTLERLLPQLRSRVGIDSAALAGTTPLSGYATNELYRNDGTRVVFKGGGELQPAFTHVSPDFFKTSGIAVERGRDFDADAATADVMIVNRAMAATLWPNQDALGQCIRVGAATRPCLTVVGVVENTNRQSLIDKFGGIAPLYFMPLAPGRSEFSTPVTAVVRSAAATDLDALAAALLADLRGILPAGTYASVTPMRETFVAQLRTFNIGAALFSTFGLLALAVAAIGTYSTLAWSISHRTREMGIRMALGAARGGLMRLVVSQGLSVVLIGVVAGVALAVALGRLIESLLYETSVHDPIVLLTACGAMVMAAVAGCLMPAWRAARVDPIVVLRAE